MALPGTLDAASPQHPLTPVACLAPRRACHGRAATPATRVASHILHDCRGAMQRDFIRVSALIECDMGMPHKWQRGRSPVMPLRLF